MDNFYEHIDIIFDDLYEKYGFTMELMNYKSQLLTAYEGEKPWLYGTKPKKQHFQIDENGYIRSV